MQRACCAPPALPHSHCYPATPAPATLRAPYSCLPASSTCVAYRLRITQLCLPTHLKHLPFEPYSAHLSPIPVSITALSVGRPHFHRDDRGVMEQWAAFSAAASDWQDRQPWRLPQADPSPQSCEEEGQSWQWLRTYGPWRHIDRTRLPYFSISDAMLDSLLRPGILPSGLQVLLLSSAYNRPFPPESLPSSPTLLQLGHDFDQPIAARELPASLLLLCMKGPMHDYHELLLPSLPASLERLILGCWPRPLKAGVRPAGLKALHLGELDRPLQPHVLPPSPLYLSFDRFRHPLLPDVLPSSLIELHFGHFFGQPLLPGTLPSSLRRLTLGTAFRLQLQVGSLPEGLLFLRFMPYDMCDRPSHLPAVWGRVLPSTLLGIDLANRY